MLHHVGTITKTSKVREFHAECSCGTAGDFATKEDAASYLQGHFGKQLGGIATVELVDKSDEPEVEPVLPLTHAASAPIPEETPAPVEGQAGEVVDPAAQMPAESETGFWPKKKKK
jgi:hypothetical protein